jgi:hypothetical protein
VAMNTPRPPAPPANRDEQRANLALLVLNAVKPIDNVDIKEQPEILKVRETAAAVLRDTLDELGKPVEHSRILTPVM